MTVSDLVNELEQEFPFTLSERQRGPPDVPNFDENNFNMKSLVAQITAIAN
jgi:hypothetical protein